jgi:hypothetical protein
MNSIVYLFDIDGVLICPGGYRRATFDTIQYFLIELLGFPFSTYEDELSCFESIGITSEWDMIPLYLLAVLELTSDYQEQNFSFVETEIFRFDLIKFLNSYQKYLLYGEAPADAVLSQWEAGLPIFPVLEGKNPELIRSLLYGTRNPEISRITGYFQNLVLGNQLFEQTCKVKAKIMTEPYLELYDKVQISTFYKQKVEQLIENQQIFSAAMTARPSINPFKPKNNPSDYFSPEAELAIKCIGLNQLSMIGFGALQAIGTAVNRTGDNFLKPSPVHAFIALQAALGGSMKTIYRLTLDYICYLENPERISSQLESFLGTLRPSIHLFVFEDSSIGIRSVWNLVETFKKLDIEADVQAFGISTHPAKIKALKNENARIFSDINQALSYSFQLSSF